MRAARLFERARWKFSHEDNAMFVLKQKRRGSLGRKAAALVSQRSGEERKAAIARAAKELWSDAPELRGSMSKTAAEIERRNLPELILIHSGVATPMNGRSAFTSDDWRFITRTTSKPG